MMGGWLGLVTIVLSVNPPFPRSAQDPGPTLERAGAAYANVATLSADFVQIVVNPTKCRGTVWDYLNAGDKDPIKRLHPAPFPDQLPYDVVQCFCPKGGVVLDPFMGSGSTAVSAKKLGRYFIGFEIAKDYCDIAERRLRKTQPLLL